jgi:hypothetical protein
VAAHSDDAIYTGLALLQTSGGPFLLAADFRHARIDVFDSNWNRVDVGSAFRDRSLPAGYAPFNVQVLGGAVYVAYALQSEDGEEEVAGHSLGFVDKYTEFGRAVTRCCPVPPPAGAPMRSGSAPARTRRRTDFLACYARQASRAQDERATTAGAERGRRCSSVGTFNRCGNCAAACA